MLDPQLEKYNSRLENPFLTVGFADLNFFSQSLKNKEFNQAINSFNKIYCDGYWLFIMLKILNKKVIYLPGPKFFNNFLKEDKKFLILSKFTKNDLKCSNFAHNFNFLQLPFINNVNEFDYKSIVTEVNKFENIFICLGCTKQEIFASNLVKYINPNRNLYTIGAAIDFYLGEEIRAPEIIIKIKLEFVWRLFKSFDKQFEKWKIVPISFKWFVMKLLKII